MSNEEYFNKGYMAVRDETYTTGIALLNNTRSDVVEELNRMSVAGFTRIVSEDITANKLRVTNKDTGKTSKELCLTGSIILGLDRKYSAVEYQQIYANDLAYEESLDKQKRFHDVLHLARQLKKGVKLATATIVLLVLWIVTLLGVGYCALSLVGNPATKPMAAYTRSYIMYYIENGTAAILADADQVAMMEDAGLTYDFALPSLTLDGIRTALQHNEWKVVTTLLGLVVVLLISLVLLIAMCRSAARRKKELTAYQKVVGALTPQEVIDAEEREYNKVQFLLESMEYFQQPPTRFAVFEDAGGEAKGGKYVLSVRNTKTGETF